MKWVPIAALLSDSSILEEEGVLAYLDDLLIHTNNSETHFNLLKLGFQAHREAGIKSNAERKHFFLEQKSSTWDILSHKAKLNYHRLM